MNSSGRESLSDQTLRAVGEGTADEPERQPLLYSEGLPFLSLLVSTMVAFPVCVISPRVTGPILAALESSAGSAGPHSLLMFMGGWLEAATVVLVLSIMNAAIHMAQRFRPFPDWMPFCLSPPIAFVLIAPSALEFGGSLRAWLAAGLMVAMVFCFQWRLFTWAREIWD
jgi:hypothetical protein